MLCSRSASLAAVWELTRCSAVRELEGTGLVMEADGVRDTGDGLTAVAVALEVTFVGSALGGRRSPARPAFAERVMGVHTPTQGLCCRRRAGPCATVPRGGALTREGGASGREATGSCDADDRFAEMAVHEASGCRATATPHGHRRLGHPTASPSAIRNSLLVVRAHRRPRSGWMPGDPASGF